MTIFTDHGEYEMLKNAYEGREMIVGLYNEAEGSETRHENPRGRLDVTGSGAELLEENIEGVSQDKVYMTEAGLEKNVIRTEPDATKSYSRQEVTVSADQIRRASGFAGSRDLTSKVTLPPVEFNVRNNTREVNTVFVMDKESGNIHFNCPLSQRLILDYLPRTPDGENVGSTVTVNNIELFIE